MTTQARPHERPRHLVVLDSIGTSGMALIAGLKAATPIPEEMLAQAFYRAPSVVARGLPEDDATRLCAQLESAGLECHVQADDAPFSPGGEAWEVALVLRRYDQMGRVLTEIMALLGLPLARARQAICQVPTMLMGRVSENTVQAVRARLEPLGVEVIGARPADSSFDVYVGAAVDPRRLTQMLERAGTPPAARGAPGSQLLAVGLDRAQAGRLWEHLRGTDLSARVINRRYQRFDVRLEAAPDTPEMRAFLVESAGMPARVVGKVLGRLPIVTHPGVDYDRSAALLMAIAELGGQATARLTAFQAFDLELVEVGDQARTAGLLAGIGGLERATVDARLRDVRRSPRLSGPFTGHQARWLVHELEQVGTRARLVERHE